jgi:uncharacterized protein (TIGR03435 family)
MFAPSRIQWGIGVLFIASASWAYPQALQTQSEFAVASVKLNVTGGGSGTRTGHGRLTATNSSIRALLKVAYKLKDFQIEGPSWIDDWHYDIEAKADGEVDNLTLGVMLQGLLQKRLALTIRRETREMSAYALVPGKSGTKLRPSELPSGAATRVSDGKLTAQGVNMGQLAEQLSRYVDKPVFDKTETPGRFDLVLEASELRDPGAAASSEPDGEPSIFAALQDQLGLKLEARKFPVEVVVVVSSNKTPTEN